MIVWRWSVVRGVFPWEEAIEAVIIKGERTAGCPRFLKLYGKDRFELGANAALSSGATVSRLIKVLSRWARRRPVLLERAAMDAQSRLKRASRYRSESIREMEGLSGGLGISLEDLLAARSIIESCAATRCTNFGAVPPATVGDDIIVSWNLDAAFVLKLLMGRFPLYVRELEGSIPYLCLGVPALSGIGILNAEGLCCVINAVPMTDDGEGFTPFELNNRAMETCSTVDEAAGIFEEGPRQATWSISLGMLMNWNMIWADMSGGLSVFEYSHNHFHREKSGKEGVIASANHHRFLDRGLSGSFDPTSLELIAGSYSRLARMEALLRDYHGRIDPRVAKLITSDHLPDYSLLREFDVEREWWEEKVDDSTICAHAWNFKKHLLKGEFEAALTEVSISRTLYSIQVQPRSMTVWFTGGFPCRNPSRPFYWGKMLGSAVEHYPPAVETSGLPGRQKERVRRGMFRSGAGPVEAFLTRVWMGLLHKVEEINSKRHG